MGIRLLHSMACFGMNAYLIQVETDILRGLPNFTVVGLPDAAVKESRDRVRFVFKNCGFSFPNGRITVNLAPADLKKSGSSFDLPIFLGILFSSGQVSDAGLEDAACVGELSLSGKLSPVNGVLPMVLAAKEAGIKKIFLPAENQQEAAVVRDMEIYGLEHVNQLLGFLEGRIKLTPAHYTQPKSAEEVLAPDFADVKGQPVARRAVEVAVAGGHNLLLIGSPGAGKSMLAKRIPGILPPMTFEESIETSRIYSIAGLLSSKQPLITVRPFRAPHHSISAAGLSGGGTIPQPGEISLAHNGVLFLDELPEFNRQAIEILRQPMEDGTVTISRVQGTLTYPCRVMVVAAMNPCPCGYFGHPTRACTCEKGAVSKYLNRISGPLLDRLDLHIDVPPVDYDSLASHQKSEPSSEIRKRVMKVRQIQQQRFSGKGIYTNAQIPPGLLEECCPMDDGAKAMLKSAFERLGLSGRAYDRILKVARTVADLEESEIIRRPHIAEAIQYRSLDRKYWSRM